MSLNPAAGGQICPNCGASNSAFSIFCAECGTSLNTRQNEDDPENTGQTTVSFTPVSERPDPVSEAWDSPRDTQATQEFTPRSPEAPSGESSASAWESDEPYATTFMARPQESRRGFVLGMISAMLIAIVIGFFFWSTIVSQGFRDSITGIF